MTKYLYLTTILLYLFISSGRQAGAVESGAKATVKAAIPAKTDVRLFGYTAPNSIVQAQGVRTFAQTSSDKTGYFMINPLPVSHEAKEVCLTTIDRERRTGFPICYPLTSDKESEIGPILLSPTLSLSKGILIQKERGEAWGMTIPNTRVVVSFFAVAKSSLADKIISPVEAADLPKISGFSDQKGNFSINLPTNKAIGFRIFAKAFYEESPTPKSQTLSFKIESVTKRWFSQILPKLLLFLFILIVSSILMAKEKKEKWATRWMAEFTEKKLGPFAVRRRLQLRRIWYNLREYWRSNRR